MSACHVKIHGDGTLSHVIEVDGHPVQDATQRVTLDIEAGNLPVLTLRLVPARSRDIDERAAVRLDDDTAAALKAMGWTPPEGS